MQLMLFCILWGIGATFTLYSCKLTSSEKDKLKEVKERIGTYAKKTFDYESASLGKQTLNYNYLLPDGFKKDGKYPLLVFLHGAGERGNDNSAQLKHGGELIKAAANKYQFIALFPQCPQEDYWIKTLEVENRKDGIRNFEPDTENPSNALSMVMHLLEAELDKVYVDPARVYVAGLSMGGMGTFDLCWRMPTTFAAAVAICGAGSVEKAKDFAELPIRIYHGEEDAVVSVDESLEMAEALEKAGGTPELIIYPGVNHDSWENAFLEPDFITWLLEHKRGE